MQTFEVGHLRLIPSFDQRFITSLNQCRESAAENRLFAEQVRFGFFFESSFDHTRAGAADALGPGQRDLLRILPRILIDRDQSGNTFAFSKLPPHNVSWPFWRDQNHIHILRRHDGLKVNRETMREEQRLSWSKIRSDVLRVSLRLLRVRKRNEDHVRAANSFPGG